MLMTSFSLSKRPVAYALMASLVLSSCTSSVRISSSLSQADV